MISKGVIHAHGDTGINLILQGEMVISANGKDFRVTSGFFEITLTMRIIYDTVIRPYNNWFSRRFAPRLGNENLLR
jgi:hypothetical protein